MATYSPRSLPAKMVAKYCAEAARTHTVVRVFYRQGVFYCYPWGQYQYIGDSNE